jgi:hypothetical protein
MRIHCFVLQSLPVQHYKNEGHAFFPRLSNLIPEQNRSIGPPSLNVAIDKAAEKLNRWIDEARRGENEWSRPKNERFE